MAKSPFSNPFVARPATPSTLAPVARDASRARGITVINVEESARASALAAELQSGGVRLAPRFVETPTIKPWPESTPVAVLPEPEAGGSKT